MEINLKLTIENGEVIKAEVIKPEPRFLGVDIGYSQYARVFDETCPNWTKSAEANLAFLRRVEQYFNDKLDFQGHLFLNEVYDGFGFPRTKAGAVVGWLKDSENGDGYVDLGLNRPGAARFVNGYETNVILDFNVDGPIEDKI